MQHHVWPRPWHSVGHSALQVATSAFGSASWRASIVARGTCYSLMGACYSLLGGYPSCSHVVYATASWGPTTASWGPALLSAWGTCYSRLVACYSHLVACYSHLVACYSLSGGRPHCMHVVHTTASRGAGPIACTWYTLQPLGGPAPLHARGTHYSLSGGRLRCQHVMCVSIHPCQPRSQSTTALTPNPWTT